MYYFGWLIIMVIVVYSRYTVNYNNDCRIILIKLKFILQKLKPAEK